MDPKANIKEQVELARGILEAEDAGDSTHQHAGRLAELVLALHEWRERGGFDPYAPQSGTREETLRSTYQREDV